MVLAYQHDYQLLLLAYSGDANNVESSVECSFILCITLYK